MILEIWNAVKSEDRNFNVKENIWDVIEYEKMKMKQQIEIIENDEWFFKWIIEWDLDTTIHWLAINSALWEDIKENKFWINLDNIAEWLLKAHWFETSTRYKFWYWLWALWWNILETLWLILLLPTWWWEAWLAIKWIQTTKAIKNIWKATTILNEAEKVSQLAKAWKIAEWAAEIKKLDTIWKVNLARKINNLNKYDKWLIEKNLAKQWLILWWVYSIQENFKEYLKWKDIWTKDILKSFIQWMAYWVLWEFWALKVLQKVWGFKWTLAAFWAAAWINTIIDYISTWKIDSGTIWMNLAFSLFDLLWAKWDYKDFIWLNEFKNVQIKKAEEIKAKEESEYTKELYNKIDDTTKEKIEKTFDAYIECISKI